MKTNLTRAVLAYSLLMAVAVTADARNVKKGAPRIGPVFTVQFCGNAGLSLPRFTRPSTDIADIALDPPVHVPDTASCNSEDGATAAAVEEFPLGIDGLPYTALGMICRIDNTLTQPIVVTLMDDQVATRLTCTIAATGVLNQCVGAQSVRVNAGSKLSMRWDGGADDLSSDDTLCYAELAF